MILDQWGEPMEVPPPAEPGEVIQIRVDLTYHFLDIDGVLRRYYDQNGTPEDR